MIFSSFYSLYAFFNTMDQNHLGPIPWIKYLGSIPRTKYHRPIPWIKYFGPKLSFPRYMCFSFPESACVRIHNLHTVNLRVYAAWSMVNLHIPLFLHYVILCCLPAILWSFIWVSCPLNWFLEVSLYFIPSVNITIMHSVTSDISSVDSSSYHI